MQNVFSSKILLKHFFYYVLHIGGNDIKFNSIVNSAIPQKAYNLVRIRKIHINKTELKIYVTGSSLWNPHIWKIQLFYMQLIFFFREALSWSHKFLIETMVIFFLYSHHPLTNFLIFLNKRKEGFLLYSMLMTWLLNSCDLINCS